MIYECKVKRWKGKIHTADFMRWPQMIAWERAIDEARSLGDQANVGDFYNKLLPVALEFITKFEIAGLPEKMTCDDFPASPRLVAFLIDSITELYRLTNEDEQEKKSGEPSLTS